MGCLTIDLSHVLCHAGAYFEQYVDKPPNWFSDEPGQDPYGYSLEDYLVGWIEGVFTEQFGYRPRSSRNPLAHYFRTDRARVHMSMLACTDALGTYFWESVRNLSPFISTWIEVTSISVVGYDLQINFKQWSAA